MSLFLRDIEYTPFEVTIAADVTKGDCLAQQDVVGFYLKDTDTDVTTKVALVTKGKQVLATKDTGTGETITKGDWVYLDVTNAKVSATKAGLFTNWCGVALESASATDSDVLINFDGTDKNRA